MNEQNGFSSKLDNRMVIFMISIIPFVGMAILVMLSVSFVNTHSYNPYLGAERFCLRLNVLSLVLAVVLCATPGSRRLGVLSLVLNLAPFAMVIWFLLQL